jgi:hypothetical protein
LKSFKAPSWLNSPGLEMDRSPQLAWLDDAISEKYTGLALLTVSFARYVIS